MTPDGSKLVEEIEVGDLLLSCPEDDPKGPIEPRRVEEVFVRLSPLLSLRVGGQVIRTTHEHPFYVKRPAGDSPRPLAGEGPGVRAFGDGRASRVRAAAVDVALEDPAAATATLEPALQTLGWTKAFLLQPGDLVRTADNRWLPVESITDTGELATVYNFRIAEYHTYFVGSLEWGFSVWSHNANYAPGSGGGDAPKGLAEGAERVLKVGTSKGRLALKSGVLKVSEVYVQGDSLLEFFDKVRQVGLASGAKRFEAIAEFLDFPFRDRLMQAAGWTFEKIGDGPFGDIWRITGDL